MLWKLWCTCFVNGEEATIDGLSDDFDMLLSEWFPPDAKSQRNEWRDSQASLVGPSSYYSYVIIY